MKRKIIPQRGFTLIEMLIALAIAALLMTVINGALSQGLQAKTYAHNANEMAYNARFALSRVITNLRTASAVTISGTSPDLILKVTPAGSAITVDYARNASKQLIETDNRYAPAIVSVLAENVTAFTPKVNKDIDTPANYTLGGNRLPVGTTLLFDVAEIKIDLSSSDQGISVSGYSRVGAF